MREFYRKASLSPISFSGLHFSHNSIYFPFHSAPPWCDSYMAGLQQDNLPLYSLTLVSVHLCPDSHTLSKSRGTIFSKLHISNNFSILQFSLKNVAACISRSHTTLKQHWPSSEKPVWEKFISTHDYLKAEIQTAWFVLTAHNIGYTNLRRPLPFLWHHCLKKQQQVEREMPI